MSVLSIILWVIANAPNLLSMVMQIIALFKTLPKDEQKTALELLAEATKSKSPTQFIQTANKLHDKCVGVGCPTELK